MNPDSGLLEDRQQITSRDMDLPTSFLRIVKQNTILYDMRLALGEVVGLAECDEGVSITSTGWYEKDEEECDEYGNQTIDQKQPLPAGKTAFSLECQQARCDELACCVGEHLAEEEECDSETCFAFLVPC